MITFRSDNRKATLPLSYSNFVSLHFVEQTCRWWLGRFQLASFYSTQLKLAWVTLISLIWTPRRKRKFIELKAPRSSQSQSGLLNEIYHLVRTLTNTVVKIKILLAESIKVDGANWHAKIGKRPPARKFREQNLFLRNPNLCFRFTRSARHSCSPMRKHQGMFSRVLLFRKAFDQKAFTLRG